MQQFQEMYYLQNLQAQEHLQSLRKEAKHHNMLRMMQKVSWRRKLAVRLVKIAERLEPTLQTPSLDEVRTSLTK